MEIVLRVEPSPALLAVLQDIAATQRETRNLLSRIAWNQAARQESAAGDAIADGARHTAGTASGAAEGEDVPAPRPPIAPDIAPAHEAEPAVAPPAQAAPAGDSQAASDVTSLQTSRPADPATPPAAPSAGGEWTDAQGAAALERIAASAPWREVFDAVHALPGKRFRNPTGLQAWLSLRRVTRATAPALLAAMAADRAPSLPAPEPNGRIYADRAQIGAWAAWHGVAFDGDMLPVQRLAARLKHPDIVCVGG